MSGNIKFRWFLLAPIVIALLVVVTSPFVSLAGELVDAQERVRLNPDDADAHYNLGNAYEQLGQYQEAIDSYKESISIKPYFYAFWKIGKTYEKLGRNDEAIATYKIMIRGWPKGSIADTLLSEIYIKLGRYQEAIASSKEAVRRNPNSEFAHHDLGKIYIKLGRYQEAIASYEEAIRIDPGFTAPHHGLGRAYEKMGTNDEALEAYKETLRIASINGQTYRPDYLNELKQKIADMRLAQKKHEASQNTKEADRLALERKLLEEERKEFEQLRLAEENRQQPPEEQTPQSGSGSGFFVSKMCHVITNAHVVKNCNKVTVGDNANKQVAAELINTDRSNDLALLKLSSLEMASAESKSLIQKLGIVVVPLASKGLLRNEDVRLGEKVLVAGYPFGDIFSNTIKVTFGIVSATRGAGDDSGQFQLDAAVQPGNSGGPIYDSSGNIVGVVISQLDKRKVEKAIGSLPENVNFGIKASTVRQFLVSSGLPSKKSERTEEKSTEQLAEIAKNQALMVMCHQ